MKIGFLQSRPKFGSIKENVRSAKSLLRNIDNATVVLPELFNCGYLFRSKDELQNLSESTISGYTVGEMKKIAKQKKLNLIFGMAEKKAGKYYNSSVLITATGKVSVYQKTHLFDREKLFFSPGDRSLAVHAIEGARIGMMVCFDWFFPEVARVLALKGALILCHPSNLVMPYCQDAMRTRSIENKVFSITANRIGTEKRGNLSLTFTGRSQVISPTGEVLAHAGERSESLKIVEIDVEQATEKSINPNNDLFRDRKVSLYRPLVSKTVR